MKKPDPTTSRKPTSRRRRVQRVFEGVVASYIHEISERHSGRPSGPATVVLPESL
jgi:hypothetical protein